MKEKFVSFAFVTVFLLLAMLETRFVTPVSANSEINEPVYSMIAEYYDNRRAVVTLTADDWNERFEQYFEDMCSMLTTKKLYHTIGIITSQNPNWTRIQCWLDQGYTEAASHSRTHKDIPYEDYGSEIGGSRDDIIGNLNLPPNFSFSDNEYVYTWIEPFGESDSEIRQKLGFYRYLANRGNTADNEWAAWDSTNGLFDCIGYSIKMGSDGIEDTATLNSKFKSVYDAGGIYHLMCHPRHVNWQPGRYADSHTDYISGRLDVWYVNFGLLYLYRWIATQNVVEITSIGSGQNKIFKISMSSTNRQDYGARYPVTYVFDIPSSWTSGYVFYRFQKSDPWVLMENKGSTDFFNGITASRFDFASHKAYVSVGFGDVSNDIYLQIRCTANVPPTADFTINSPLKPAFQSVIQFTDRSSDPDGLIVSWHWEFGDGTTSNDQNPIHIYENSGIYTIKLTVTDDDGATAEESEIFDALPPTTIDDYDGSWHTEDFTITLTATDDYSGVQVIYYRINDGPAESVQAEGQPHITIEGNNNLEYWSVDEAGNEETHHIIVVKLDKTVPVANVGGNRSVAQNILVTFDASKSSDNVGIVSYEWDFGDGSKGTGLTITHTYNEPGTYVVWLTVKDAADNRNTNSVSVTVLKDTDGDGKPDTTDTDDDGDGMPDAWELSYGLDPLDATDAFHDSDGDGLSNLEECQAATDPTFYFSPFPWWIIVLVAASGTIFIIGYAIALPGKQAESS